MVDDGRVRVLDAAVACFGRVGIAKTTVEDVAAQAGVARASVYRWFPGGRDQLVVDAIGHEVGRFFEGLESEMAGATDLATSLETLLMYVHRTLLDHAVLQRVLETEPERLLPHLSEAGPAFLQVVAAVLLPIVAEASLTPGVTPAEATDWLARMVLSFTASQGRWDFTDTASIRSLVREELLPGVLSE
ncbi:MAG: TetR/AcrR family transcriptional regulator [Acidimicrobiales bacterium]